MFKEKSSLGLSYRMNENRISLYAPRHGILFEFKDHVEIEIHLDLGYGSRLGWLMKN
jgi:hypothetical protein